MRCEPNISVRPAGHDGFNDKAELKNLNSIRVVELGIRYETARQGLVLQKRDGVDLGVTADVPGSPPLKVDLSDNLIRQETRRWDEGTMRTVSMRTKEYAHDYRYFPEPDLVPLYFDDAWISRVREQLPVLPEERLARYTGEYGLSDYDAALLVDERPVSDYFDAAVAAYGGDAKKVANWMQSDWARLFNAGGREWSALKVKPENLALLVRLIDEGKITGKIAKSVFETMWETGKGPEAIVQEQGIQVVGDESALEGIVEQVCADNPKIVADIEKGQDGKMNFIVGQVMKATKGSARPDVVQRLVRKRFGKE